MSDAKPISDPIAFKKPSKDYPWWLDNIDHKITPEVRQVLEQYSGICSDDVRSHIYAIREKAWNIRPYPCTGIGAFLSPSISRQPAYSFILSRIKAGGKFLDIGCYMGQDLRRLVLDGAPQFFNDKDKFHVPYIESDLLFPTDELKTLHGQIDIISVVHVLHQWDWDTQILACRKLAKFSKPGSLVVGWQGGTSDIAKRSQSNREAGQAEFTLHDAQTFARMWNLVGQQTGTKWDTEAVIVSFSELSYRDEEVAYLGSDIALLRFAVTRVE